MKFNSVTRSTGLESHGISNCNLIYWNAPTPVLYEQIAQRREGLISHLGPIVVKTGHYTGRAAKDKFIVEDPDTREHIWWGDINRPFSSEKFDRIYDKLCAYLHGKDVFVQDCYAGASPTYRLPIRVITEKAWHSLFARIIFIRPEMGEVEHITPGFTIIDVPEFHSMPQMDGTNSEAFILINFARKIILIGGTSYSGEIKKSVFTLMNYLMPHENKVLSMHSSANIGKNGDTTVFFGLSGTGKTTLSTNKDRRLIGDDEHGWDDNGVFNFEGGSYAKVIGLSPEAEPEIYDNTRRFGTILENVAIDTVTRRIDLSDDSFTENTRASYPITHIPNSIVNGMGGHPSNIIMLTCDALGVLPPVSLLTPEQAVYHFLSGYTAKVAGTEAGISEPQVTFSTCFGAPFMALHPSVYAKLLAEKIQKHNVRCWLVNTGWTGGQYGVGHRIRIADSRAIIDAIHDNSLTNGEFSTDNAFKLAIPTKCNNVATQILNPREAWTDKAAYDKAAAGLITKFRDNFMQFGGYVEEDVRDVM